MRPRIKYKEKVIPKSSTTIEATTYYKKIEHLQTVIEKKLSSMGIDNKISVQVFGFSEKEGMFL